MSLLTEDIGMERAGLSLWVEGKERGGMDRGKQRKTEACRSIQPVYQAASLSDSSSSSRLVIIKRWTEHELT